MAFQAGNIRYHRQTVLNEFGESGQQKLHQAKVLVAGAGGLGCPALQYLVAAGIGTIGIADHDTVSLSNLHRQVLYSTDDVGLSKALRSAEILAQLNPEIDIISHNEMLNTENSLRIISQYDIILDGTDNFGTRYMINDACVLTGKTLVYGAISRFEGQVAVFNHPGYNTASVNYRDLFPEPPSDGEILNCAEAGVLGVLPGIIGTMMANETIKLITGIGQALVNRLLTYNCLNNQTYELEIMKRPESLLLIPGDVNEFKRMDYDLSCTVAATEIDENTFENMLHDSQVTFVDVREAGELPEIHDFDHLKIPMSAFREGYSQIRTNTIVLFCQSGQRSRSAVQLLTQKFGKSKKIYSLRGGIMRRKSKKI